MNTVKLKHENDMVSSGICLYKKGWFGDDEKGKHYGRMAFHVILTSLTAVIKYAAVFFVGSFLMGNT